MAKQVLCWNQANGCNVVTAAESISKHFHHDCEHHLVRCPKCAAGILATDVCAHLETHGGAAKVSNAAPDQPTKTVSQGQETFSSRTEVTKQGLQIPTVNPTAVSSIQAQLREISRVFNIALAETFSNDADTNKRNSKQRQLQDSLAQLRLHMSEQKDQPGDFVLKSDVNQQGLNNSMVESDKARMQSPSEAVQLEIGHNEPDATLRKAIEDGRREAKAELATQFAEFRTAIKDELRVTTAELAMRLNALGETIKDGDTERKAELSTQFTEVTEAIGDGHRKTKAELTTHFATLIEAMEVGRRETAAELAMQFPAVGAAIKEELREKTAELSTRFEAFKEAMGNGHQRTKAELITQFAAFREAVEDRHQETKTELTMHIATLIEATRDGHHKTTAELATHFGTFIQAMGDGHRKTTAELATFFSEFRKAVRNGQDETKGELAGQFAAFTKAMEGRHRETKAELATSLSAFFGASSEGHRKTAAELAAQSVEFREAIRAGNRQTNAELAAHFAAFREAVAEEHSETKAEMVAEHTAYIEALEDGNRKAKVVLDRISAAIDSQCDRTSDLFRNSSALMFSILNVAAKTRHKWILEKYAPLKQKAKEDCVLDVGEPVYLRGYYVSAGLVFYGDGDIGFCFRIHEGLIDQFQEWPFNLQLKFSILHPQGPEKLCHSTTPSALGYGYFSRPTKVRGHPIKVHDKYFKPENLESGGFVRDGRVILSLDLQPIVDAAP